MSSLILFIAAMLIAVGVAGTMVTNVAQISSAIDSKSLDAEQTIDRDRGHLRPGCVGGVQRLR